MAVRAFAPAKVNLYLHVVGRRADGYHLLDSLVAFADIGDWVTAAPAEALSLTIDGPEAGELATAGEENLVSRAAGLLAEAIGQPSRAAFLHLEKRLPVSSGIGGGSSDAAATLRALMHLWDVASEPATMAALALGLGADVPVCLTAEPAWLGGIGEQIAPIAGLPPAGIVLANPRRALATPQVFRGRQGPFGQSGRFAAMPGDAADLAAILASRRNDLTDAALTIVPGIADVLHRLGELPGALLARMSGSGATCFALFEDRASASAARAALVRTHPQWWSAAGALMNVPPAVEIRTDRD
ncbi:MAG TPA: 4-(cytidine 5'-diphospho)-2-C-methyl-D-erythritol kinase [Stellaceae bacterium]|nr:4-(cytidine 5'-diphospho)-2-C-methyl-D-erythritol kinase [Stellaceae bacterium]